MTLARTLLVALACALPALALPSIALAQSDYPSKPIHIVVGFPPGQATDVIARVVGERITAAMGQPVVIDNKPGQGGGIGAAAAAKAAPDGYTMLISATGPLATNPNLYKNLPYDSVKDFAPITLIANLPFVLVCNPNVPVHNIREMIALAKSKPGQLTFASSGSGSTSHLSMEMLKAPTGMDIRHVPYKGSAPAFTDVMGGQVDFVFDTAVYALPQVRAGRVRLLAVASARRSTLIPDVPTVAEQGVPGYESGAWLGALFPAGTPQPIVARMYVELNKIMKAPEISEKLSTLGGEPLSSASPEQFHNHIRSELKKWGKAVTDSGARIE